MFNLCLCADEQHESNQSVLGTVQSSSRIHLLVCEDLVGLQQEFSPPSRRDGSSETNLSQEGISEMRNADAADGLPHQTVRRRSPEKCFRCSRCYRKLKDELSGKISILTGPAPVNQEVVEVGGGEWAGLCVGGAMYRRGYVCEGLMCRRDCVGVV